MHEQSRRSLTKQVRIATAGSFLKLTAHAMGAKEELNSDFEKLQNNVPATVKAFRTMIDDKNGFNAVPDQALPTAYALPKV
jgi:hypothetical protein